jgi:phosphatidylinositol alpha-mannosyltransferase
VAVYETVAPSGGIGVTASAEDDAALLGEPPSSREGDPAAVGPFRRRVRR